MMEPGGLLSRRFENCWNELEKDEKADYNFLHLGDTKRDTNELWRPCLFILRNFTY